MKLLESRDQASLTDASPMWWLMPEARGENSVSEVPRSRCSLSCAPSTEARN